MLLPGCAMWPYKERYVIATRPRSVTDTNAVERLIQSDTGIESWALLKPCYAGPPTQKAAIHRSFFVRDQKGKRTDLKHFEFLKEKDHPDWTGRRNLWFSYPWKVRPVIGTNLWVAMNIYPGGKLSGNDTHHAQVYIFEPRRIVAERELIGLRWDPNDFRLDAENRRITYRTEKGFETLDVVENKILSPTDTK
jgi:hypothetical protein